MSRVRSLNLFIAVLCLTVWGIAACSKSAEEGAKFDADGTAHVTRVIPMPATVSAESQKWLESLAHRNWAPQTLAERRAATDQWRAEDSAEARKIFPVKVEEKMIAGVRTDIITPDGLPEQNRSRVLINLHGGGFNSDSGSLIEGVPIASLAKTKVVSIYYRLAPENPFPAAVDDVVRVYTELSKEYKPASIGIFGTSAGAILTGEVAVKLKQLGLPLPGALGIFSTLADFSKRGDSLSFFTLDGLPGTLLPPDPHGGHPNEYAGNADRKDPVLSPVYADLHGFPPSLLITSTRDLLLSDTTIFHRVLLRAGNDSQLVVFEALPHAFWYHFQLPETRECLALMANFFDQKVAR
ncbi:MAG TPA: alpha/beta hydrolase [Candidatus Limnocylindrales bacterium]|nr:alpha/beta hydrolase [Candidatus Limnocylindrales bacterium]